MVLLAPVSFGQGFPVYWTGSANERFHAAAGDVDGDGFADLVLVSAAQPSLAAPQQAFVRSGLNGSLLRTWTPSVSTFFTFPPGGRQPAGDLDLDGFADVALAILSPPPSGYGEMVEVRSGLDASVMALIGAPPSSGSLVIGSNIAGAGDMDGDGLREL